MNWSVIGAALLALAVIIGAFGAHALQGRLDAYSKGVYETGVMYHFFHALGLLVVSFLPRIGALTSSRATWICALLLAGVVLFSGSLYALARLHRGVDSAGLLAIYSARLIPPFPPLTAILQSIHTCCNIVQKV
jgi:uncharacterized membrane protein YgdD (TMEM256/DUF423 family)